MEQNKKLVKDIKQYVNQILDQAELQFNCQKRINFIKKNKKLKYNHYKKCFFLFADIRNSTKDVIQTKENDYKYLYLQHTAFLASFIKFSKLTNGFTYQISGDGIIILYKIKNNKMSHKVLKKIYSNSLFMVSKFRIYINNILYKRYKLNSINFGIGISYGKYYLNCFNHNDTPFSIFSPSLYIANVLCKGINSVQLCNKTKKLLQKICTKEKISYI